MERLALCLVLCLLGFKSLASGGELRLAAFQPVRFRAFASRQISLQLIQLSLPSVKLLLPLFEEPLSLFEGGHFGVCIDGRLSGMLLLARESRSGIVELSGDARVKVAQSLTMIVHPLCSAAALGIDGLSEGFPPGVSRGPFAKRLVHVYSPRRGNTRDRRRAQTRKRASHHCYRSRGRVGQRRGSDCAKWEGCAEEARGRRSQVTGHR